MIKLVLDTNSENFITEIYNYVNVNIILIMINLSLEFLSTSNDPKCFVDCNFGIKI
jgi:hypothetical protein